MSNRCHITVASARETPSAHRLLHAAAIWSIAALISLILWVWPRSIAHAEASGQATPTQSVSTLKKQASRAQNERGVRAVRAHLENEAEEAFRKALIYDTENLTAVYNLAGLYLNSKRPEKAVQLLERYVPRYENNANLSVRLGDAFFSSRRVDEAEIAYERAFALVPDYQGLPLKLATLYGLKQDFQKAEQMLELATAQTPNDPHLLNNLGNIYILNGKAQQAVDVAKQALQVYTSKESYLTLGNAYEAQRDYEKSLIAFERARDLGVNSPELAEKIEKLRKSAATGG